MDPNAALAMILRLARKLVLLDSQSTQDAYDLAEAVEDLDRWITSGGFLPDRWERESDG